MAKPVTLPTANVTSADGELSLLNVRFLVREDVAYVLDGRGRQVWGATITGYERHGNRWTVHLADGPDVTAEKFCAPCKAARGT